MLARSDRSFLRPSRRAAALAGPDGEWPDLVAMPGRRVLPAGRLVSVVDTSSSVDAATLARFLGALSAVATAEGFDEIRLVQADAAVTRDVPPYVMAVGRPAVPHSVNSEGLKRRGFTTAQIQNIRRAYRVLYRSGLKLNVALEELEKAAATQAEIRPFVEFIKRSERSIVR